MRARLPLPWLMAAAALMTSFAAPALGPTAAATPSSDTPVSGAFVPAADGIAPPRAARIAVSADGSRVVSWIETLPGSGSFDRGLYVRRYDAAGNALQPPQLLAALSEVEAVDAGDLAIDAAGRAVIVHSKLAFVTDAPGAPPRAVTTVVARRQASAGGPFGAPFEVGIASEADASLRPRPSVAMQPDGAFAVAWVSDQVGFGLPPPGEPAAIAVDGVVIQAFDRDGVPLGSGLLSPGSVRSTRDPELAATGNGGYAAVWLATTGSDASGAAPVAAVVQARRVSPSGSPVAAVLAVSAATTVEFAPGPFGTTVFRRGRPAIAGGSGAAFAASWQEQVEQIGPGRLRRQRSTIRANAFASDGGSLRGPFAVDATTPAIERGSALGYAPNGDLLIAWDRLTPAPGLSLLLPTALGRDVVTAVLGRLLGEGALGIVQVIDALIDRVGTALGGNESLYLATGLPTDVLLRRFDLFGEPRSAAQVVNDRTRHGVEAAPDVAIDAAGRATAVWEYALIEDRVAGDRRAAVEGIYLRRLGDAD